MFRLATSAVSSWADMDWSPEPPAWPRSWTTTSRPRIAATAATASWLRRSRMSDVMARSRPARRSAGGPAPGAVGPGLGTARDSRSVTEPANAVDVDRLRLGPRDPDPERPAPGPDELPQPGAADSRAKRSFGPMAAIWYGPAM